MKKPMLFAVGRVARVAMVTPQKGKPFLSVTVLMEPEETADGRKFQSRFEARVYYKMEELQGRLREGMLVTVKGEAGAESFKHQGKDYGKLLAGRAEISVISEGGVGPVGTEAQKASPVATGPKPPPAEEEDPVPF